MTDLKKLFAPPQESLFDIFWRLQMIKDCMSLPDPRKLKAGTYRQGKKVEEKSGSEWIACEPEVADIFETSSVGFAPAPMELKSFKKWNKEQREKK